MSKPGRPAFGRSWLMCFGLGAVLFLVLLYSRGGFEAPDQEAFWHILCDALFVPGVLLTGLGLLIVVAGEGAFAAIHYGLQKLFGLMRSEKKRAALPKTYFDFVQQRYGQKTVVPVALLTAGLCFLAAAGVSLIFYYQAVV